MNNQNPIVSISCLAYNHEEFIRDTLNGFIMQKVNFPFEVLIHDDASTDDTAKIIKEYEIKYPHIIKPIYQVENQYSKPGVKQPGRYNMERAKGKYYALCEGDDYWTDPLKLQKQVDFMERHPDIIFSFHGADVLHHDGTITKFREPELINEYKVDKSKFITKGGGAFHTASVMYRMKLIKFPIPKYFNKSPVGDFALTLLASHRGEIGYIPDNMAVYRYMHPTSWTNNRSLEQKLKNSKAILDTIKLFDIETNKKFTPEVKSLIKGANSAIVTSNIMHKDYLTGLITIAKYAPTIGYNRTVYNLKVLINKAIS